MCRTAIHPDTGDLIPWPMRISSFMPINISIGMGMILTAPTTFNTLAWHWMAQTYNALVTYGNRNASLDYTIKDIFKSYM